MSLIDVDRNVIEWCNGCMELKTFIGSLSQEERDKFAALCETTAGHLRNVGYGIRPCSPFLAALIESASKGAVTRKELRPDDWHRIWPELAKRRPSKQEA